MKETNENVVIAFCKHHYAEGGNLQSMNNRLYSYRTCLAEFDENGNLWVNVTRYSNTTSKHLGKLLRQLQRREMTYTMVTDFPCGGCGNLKEYPTTKQAFKSYKTL